MSENKSIGYPAHVVINKKDFKITASPHGMISHPVLLEKMKSITISQDAVFTIKGPVTKMPWDVYTTLICFDFAGISFSKMAYVAKEIVDNPDQIETIFLGDIKISGEARNAVIQLIKQNIEELS